MVNELLNLKTKLIDNMFNYYVENKQKKGFLSVYLKNHLNLLLFKSIHNSSISSTWNSDHEEFKSVNGIILMIMSAFLSLNLIGLFFDLSNNSLKSLNICSVISVFIFLMFQMVYIINSYENYTRYMLCKNEDVRINNKKRENLLNSKNVIEEIRSNNLIEDWGNYRLKKENLNEYMSFIKTHLTKEEILSITEKTRKRTNTNLEISEPLMLYVLLSNIKEDPERNFNQKDIDLKILNSFEK